MLQTFGSEPVIGDSLSISKSSNQSIYAPGEDIRYDIRADINKNNTSPILMADTVDNTFMRTNSINFNFNKSSNFTATDVLTLKLYKNGGTTPYDTVTINPNTNSNYHSTTYTFSGAATDQLTKWEIEGNNLPKDDYVFKATINGTVLKTDRNGIDVIDGDKLKNDVSIENNGVIKTATTSPTVKVIYNQIRYQGTSNRNVYVGELATKVQNYSYNGAYSYYGIVLAKDSDITLTSSIDTLGKPFIQVVKSSSSISSEFFNKQYEVKLYKNGSATPYKTFTSTTGTSSYQDWFDESATFTGTTDLLTKYEITIKDVKAYSKTQSDSRYIYMLETMNVLYVGPNGEIPVSGNYVAGGPVSENIVGDVIYEKHDIALSTGEKSSTQPVGSVPFV